jgi:hypothetical protein
LDATEVAGVAAIHFSTIRETFAKKSSTDFLPPVFGDASLFLK